jgi:hypothetical protein
VNATFQCAILSWCKGLKMEHLVEMMMNEKLVPVIFKFWTFS